MQCLHPAVVSDEAIPFLRLLGVDSASFEHTLNAIMNYHLTLEENDDLGSADNLSPENESLLRSVWEQIRFLYDHVGLLSAFMRDLQLAILLPCITTQSRCALKRPYLVYEARIASELFRDPELVIDVPVASMSPFSNHSDADTFNFQQLTRALGCHSRPRLVRSLGSMEFEMSHELKLLLNGRLNKASSPEVAIKQLLLFQENWEYYFQSVLLRRALQAFSESAAIFLPKAAEGKESAAKVPISQCFVDTKEIRDLAGDMVPYVPGTLHDLSLLTLLGVSTSLNETSLKKISKVFEALKVTDVAIWKRLYEVCMNQNAQPPNFIFVPTPEWPPNRPHPPLDVFGENNMVKLNRVRAVGDPEVAGWAERPVLEPTYGAELAAYLAKAKGHPMIYSDDCILALVKILFEGKEKSLRQVKDVIKLQPVILKIYKQIEVNLETGADPTRFDNVLVLGKEGFLRSLKQEHTRKGLLIPDDPTILRLFADTTVSFVHPELAKLPLFTELVLATKLQKASQAVIMAPCWSDKDGRADPGPVLTPPTPFK
jgi:hypothetical protein